MPSNTGLRTILNAVVADGVGTAQSVATYDKIFFQLGGDTGSAGTLKFQGSFSDDCPDFSASRTKTNNWDYIDVIDLQNGSSIDGDTGITLAAEDVRNLEANVGGLRWVNGEISSWSAGEWTLKCFATHANIIRD